MGIAGRLAGTLWFIPKIARAVAVFFHVGTCVTCRTSLLTAIVVLHPNSAMNCDWKKQTTGKTVVTFINGITRKQESIDGADF